MRLTARERFISKIEILPSGCWRWKGSTIPNGYGNFRGYNSAMVMAHRFAYEEFIRPIPAGLQIDHLCRNKWCVNPDHLEPVTCRENALRGEAPSVALHLSGRCAKGHTDIVPVGKDKKLQCRECKRLAQQTPARKEYHRNYQREWQRRKAAERKQEQRG